MVPDFIFCGLLPTPTCTWFHLMMHRVARNTESCGPRGEVTVYHAVKSCCGHQAYPEAQNIMHWDREVLHLNFQSWPGACVQAGVCTEGERLHAGLAGPGSYPCGCFVQGATGKPSTTVTLWAARQCTALKGLSLSKGDTSSMSRITSFFSASDNICVSGKREKPVNVTIAVGILARQHIYSTKEVVSETVYFILTKPETLPATQKQTSLVKSTKSIIHTA